MGVYDERAREKKRLSYLANRDAKVAAQKRWNAANPDKRRASSKRWAEAHREEERERAASFRRERPDRAKEIHLKSRIKHAAKNRERNRRWRLENPERGRLYARRRLARKRRAGGRHTIEDVRGLLRLQRKRCAHSWCRRSLRDGYHVDHKIPLARGGSDAAENLQLLCAPCNQRKGTNDHIEWARKHGMLL